VSCLSPGDEALTHSHTPKTHTPPPPDEMCEGGGEGGEEIELFVHRKARASMA